MSYFDKYKDIGVLVGQTLSRIVETEDNIQFTTIEGNRYKMMHQQD